MPCGLIGLGMATHSARRMPRRFPPPWTTERLPGGYVVKDAIGQALAYVYARDTKADAEPQRCSRWTRHALRSPERKKKAPERILSRGYSLGREISPGTPTLSRGYDLDPFRYQRERVRVCQYRSLNVSRRASVPCRN